jgi:hypothetical protein
MTPEEIRIAAIKREFWAFPSTVTKAIKRGWSIERTRKEIPREHWTGVPGRTFGKVK